MKTQKKSAPSNERLAEIYRTAAQIILRKGYDATSINDIANALGMTKAGLYHYINGKKELLFDIMNFGLDELDEEVATPAASIPDSVERLRFIIRGRFIHKSLYIAFASRPSHLEAVSSLLRSTRA